jgi:hypothetical protein
MNVLDISEHLFLDPRADGYPMECVRHAANRRVAVSRWRGGANWAQAQRGDLTKHFAQLLAENVAH